MEFPIEKLTINNKEYIWMKKKVFYDFFLAIAQQHNIDKDLVEYVKKLYKKSDTYKKSRIRWKKEKQVLLFMHDILFTAILNKQRKESRNDSIR